MWTGVGLTILALALFGTTFFGARAGTFADYSDIGTCTRNSGRTFSGTFEQCVVDRGGTALSWCSSSGNCVSNPGMTPPVTSPTPVATSPTTPPPAATEIPAVPHTPPMSTSSDTSKIGNNNDGYGLCTTGTGTEVVYQQSRAKRCPEYQDGNTYQDFDDRCDYNTSEPLLPIVVCRP